MESPEINKRVQPPTTPKVAAALQVLEFLREQEQPTFIISSADDPKLMPQPSKALDAQEKALKSAALRYLLHYFLGEMD